jgi:ATP-dependent protease Clp ATPase subunit
MEQFMMKLMYELPSDETADTVTITRRFILGKEDAAVSHKAVQLSAPAANDDPCTLPASED